MKYAFLLIHYIILLYTYDHWYMATVKRGLDGFDFVIAMGAGALVELLVAFTAHGLMSSYWIRSKKSAFFIWLAFMFILCLNIVVINYWNYPAVQTYVNTMMVLAPVAASIAAGYLYVNGESHLQVTEELALESLETVETHEEKLRMSKLVSIQKKEMGKVRRNAFVKVFQKQKTEVDRIAQDEAMQIINSEFGVQPKKQELPAVMPAYSGDGE